MTQSKELTVKDEAKPVAAPKKRKAKAKVQSPQIVPAQQILKASAEAVAAGGLDVAQMRELIQLHRELQLDQDRREFHQHMAELQAEIQPIAADAENPGKGRYASYPKLDRALRPHYTKHGFSVGFDSEPSAKGEDYERVVCIVSRGGYSTRHGIDVAMDTKGVRGGDVMTKTHASVAVVSYGKRNALALAFNLTTDKDLDGNSVVRVITAKQIQELTKIAHEVHADIPAFCKDFGVNSMAEIASSSFNTARSRLYSKRIAAELKQERENK